MAVSTRHWQNRGFAICTASLASELPRDLTGFIHDGRSLLHFTSELPSRGWEYLNRRAPVVTQPFSACVLSGTKILASRERPAASEEQGLTGRKAKENYGTLPNERDWPVRAAAWSTLDRECD